VLGSDLDPISAPESEPLQPDAGHADEGDELLASTISVVFAIYRRDDKLTLPAVTATVTRSTILGYDGGFYAVCDVRLLMRMRINTMVVGRFRPTIGKMLVCCVIQMPSYRGLSERELLC
jgi:hypothetical protein